MERTAFPVQLSAITPPVSGTQGYFSTGVLYEQLLLFQQRKTFYRKLLIEVLARCGTHACHPPTWDAEVRGSGVQGYPLLHIEFEGDVGHMNMRPIPPQTNNNKIKTINLNLKQRHIRTKFLKSLLGSMEPREGISRASFTLTFRCLLFLPGGLIPGWPCSCLCPLSSWGYKDDLTCWPETGLCASGWFSFQGTLRPSVKVKPCFRVRVLSG